MSQVDWFLKQRIEADICLLYHQLVEYSGLMPDLDYNRVFNLDYWEFLDFKEIHDEERAFIRDGCLVIILAMCLEFLEGCGTYIQGKLEICERRLSYVVPDDEKTLKLLETVQMAVQLVRTEQLGGREIEESVHWVFQEYVQGYFRRIVNTFD